ncbi:MAG TPA: PHP-associated domain-containing protein [Dehalococcoidia bacterium]
MGRADLHIHTREGDGLDSVQAIFDHVEAETDLDVIAITEHDHLETALRAREAWARGRYRFDFVPGVEITTLEGHVVALYLQEPVASLRRVEETIEAVRRQGGVCFAPHPTSWLTRSIGAGTFGRLLARRGEGLWFDGIELASASPAGRFYIDRARRLNDESWALPVVGASDAHFVEAIGSAYTQFDGSSAADLRSAFAGGAVSGQRRRFPSLRRVGPGRLLGVAVAGLGATPRRLGWRRTAWSFVSRYL